MTLPLSAIVTTSSRVAATSGRLEKIALLADCLRGAHGGEVATAVAFLSGETRQGRLGAGYAALRDAMPGSAAAEPELTVSQVDEAFDRLVATTGAGSQAERGKQLSDLLARATRSEQEFLSRLVIGELRQGALEGVMVDAVAKSARVSGAAVRRALMFSGDLGRVAEALFTEGRAGLARFSIALFRPVKPMLAQSADDVGAAFDQLGTACMDYKLDGARVQVHKAGDDVRVFTRTLNDVTRAVPEVVEGLREHAAADLILDGEVIALRPDGKPQPFQVTMRRFGRKLDIAAMREGLPLGVWYFDCLYAGGQSLIDEPTEERSRALFAALPGDLVIPRLVTADVTAAGHFLDQALAAGHEGVMAKALGASYEAGRRGKGWLKIKPVHTLDLVVLAAEWGHGRRKGWLSNLHLGARDPEGGFVMLGKTFKGLTDATLKWQTEQLLQREVGRDRHVVRVDPTLVVEIAFNDVQASPRYPGGMALRFARVKRYRPDKRADQADTIDLVREIYRQSLE